MSGDAISDPPHFRSYFRSLPCFKIWSHTVQSGHEDNLKFAEVNP
jgi:hypothetical protein